MGYTIYRGEDKVVDNQKMTGVARETVMQNDYVEANFHLTEPVTFKTGDKITVFGKDYYANIPDEHDKQSSRDYVYRIIFEAKWYELNRIKLKFPDEYDNLTITEHSVMINAAGLLTLITQNMTAAGYLGYTIGQCDETDEKMFDFSNDNCMQALVKLYDTYGLEFWFNDTEINFGKRTLATAYTMKYGKGNGLYSLSRKNKFTSNPFNKLFVKGGTRNLPPDYGSDRLRLPSGYFIKDDALIEEYKGVIEDTKTFDDIFPKRYGTVTAVDPGDKFVFFDSSIDFDINAHILGTTDQPVKPVIIFENGLLGGYELTLASYDHTTKKITLETNTSEKLAEIPGDAFYPQVGEKYGIYDILMPQSYIDASELELLTEGQAFFDDNKKLENRYLYGLETDPLHIRRNYIEPTTEKNIRVIDEAMGVDEVLRVNSVSRPISNGDNSPVDIYKFEVELSSVVSASYQVLTQMEKKEDEIYKNGIKTRLNINTRAARQYFSDYNDLIKTLFDPTGGDLTSIEALAAKFGTDNQNLDFDGVVFSPNYTSDPSKINISAGTLIHYIYKVDDSHYTWTMGAKTVSGLDPTKLYYVYAKISKTSTVDTDWIISESKMLYDSIAGYYVIHVGTLMKVVNGKRRYYFVKGVTTILGDTITTGRIMSADGTSFIIDLDNGTIVINGGSNDNITVYSAKPTAYKRQDRWIPVTTTTISGITFTAGKTYVSQYTASFFSELHWKLDTMVYVQSTAPQKETAYVGSVWIDTGNGNVTKTYDGVNWVLAAPNGATIYKTTPSGYKKGDLFIPDSNTTIGSKTFYANKIYVASGNTGNVEVDFGDISTEGATIFTDTMPIGWKVGDLFIPSSNVTVNGKTFYEGKVYRAISASGTVDTAFEEVNYQPGVQVYTTQPTNYVKGDIWDVATTTVISGIQFTAGERYVSQMTATSFSATHWRNEKMIYVQDTAPQAQTTRVNALWVDTSKGNVQKFFDGTNWVEKGTSEAVVYSESPAKYSIGDYFIPLATVAIGSTIFYDTKAYKAATKTGNIPVDFVEVAAGDYYRTTPTGWSAGDLFRPTAATTIGSTTFLSDKLYKATGYTGSVEADFTEVAAGNIYWSHPMPYKAGDMIIPKVDFTIGGKTFHAGKIYRSSGNTGVIVDDFAEINYGKSTSYVGSSKPSGSDFNVNDTWLETNANGGKLWYWDGTDWVQGVKGEDPSGAVADYLNDALIDISTEITKGLVLSGVIGAKNSSGVVTAYMNGSDYTIGSNPSQICFAAGVTNFGLTTETQLFAVLRDGSGWFAGGKTKLNADGSMEVGGFRIESGKITGYGAPGLGSSYLELTPFDGLRHIYDNTGFKRKADVKVGMQSGDWAGIQIDMNNGVSTPNQATGVLISTYGSTSKGIDITANNNGYAITSTGGHLFGQNHGDYWSAPGCLLALDLLYNGGTSVSIVAEYHITPLAGASASVTNSSGQEITVTHNLGHTNYCPIVMISANSGGGTSTCYVKTKSSNSFVIDADNLNGSGNHIAVMMFGENKW